MQEALKIIAKERSKFLKKCRRGSFNVHSLNADSALWQWQNGINEIRRAAAKLKQIEKKAKENKKHLVTTEGRNT